MLPGLLQQRTCPGERLDGEGEGEGLVMLAIKPQQAAAACGEIGPALAADAVIVSIVAGLSTTALSRLTVHIRSVPSGEKDGSTSAPAWSVRRTGGPIENVPSASRHRAIHRS